MAWYEGSLFRKAVTAKEFFKAVKHKHNANLLAFRQEKAKLRKARRVHICDFIARHNINWRWDDAAQADSEEPSYVKKRLVAVRAALVQKGDIQQGDQTAMDEVPDYYQLAQQALSGGRSSVEKVSIYMHLY